MGQVPEQRSATRALLVLAVFTFALAVVPNAIPALDALRRFVAVPAIGILILVAVLGSAGCHALVRGRGRQPPDT